MKSTRTYQFIRRAYWRLPLSQDLKERMVARARILRRRLRQGGEPAADAPPPGLDKLQAYAQQILRIPDKPGPEHVELCETPHQPQAGDPKVIAYYLPQFHPTPENDAWWGRGVTEWNNVCRAVPQYVGHYQPRLPGELGYYDLRIRDNIARQIELAKAYGVHGFAYYYYWFDGRRVLDGPLDALLGDPSLDFPFCLCWANESWTRRFDGTCGEVLLHQSETPESYRAFIESVIPYMRDERYIRVDGRPVLIVYRPSFVPDIGATLAYWREYCRSQGVGDPYLIGVLEHTWDKDLVALGFDAQTEFHPGTLFKHCSVITDRIDYVQEDFGGIVLDYEDIVVNRRYHQYAHRKLYRAVMPMWDNTARRNNMGMIFHGATPQLYKRWLKDVMTEARNNEELEDRFVFVNAWNEWGEGTYLEPDKRYGYAYLQATRDAIEETRPSAVTAPRPDLVAVEE